jgi:ribosome-associated translation inhibitor RaiA
VSVSSGGPGVAGHAKEVCMQVPVQVTFRDMPVSDAVEAACWDEAAKLEQRFDGITSCRIVLAELAETGRGFEIRIVLNVPGQELAITRKPHDHQAGEDIIDAVREAFEITRRELEAYLHHQV